ncbi:hypothetical protein PL81_30635 [Streptomyces sp. RSD-27]|nr:hypothetical protein PL81_30635 [Streptomyces sp. RSD-27]
MTSPERPAAPAAPTGRQELIEAALAPVISEAGPAGSTVVLLVDGDREVLVERGGPGAALRYYQLGSLSKFVTAVGCLALHGAGRLDLDHPLETVGDFVPRYLGHPVPLTPRHILHHLTGLNVGSVPGYPRADPVPDLPAILQGHGRSPRLAFTGLPTGRVVYSSGGFALLQLELERHHGSAVPVLDAVTDAVPGVEVRQDLPGTRPAPDLAQGFIHAAIPVPDGSLHYPETLAGGLWARPGDLMHLLTGLGAHLRGGGGRVGHRIREDLLSLRFHQRMAMSVLVDRDSAGRTFYHHQGFSAGFTTEFVSYPHQDVHVVAMTSAAVTPPELRGVVKQAVAASSVGASASAAARDRLLSPATRPGEDGPPSAGSYAGDSLTVEVAGEHATVRTRGGYEAVLRRTAEGAYGVPDRPHPRCVVDAERLRFDDGTRLYKLARLS